MTPELILKNVFGYDDFRMNQKDVIYNILSGKNSLAIMPTGGGKSLCYQVPSLLLDGLTIVISPLVSLMKDQVEQLKEIGIEADYLNSTSTKEEKSIIFNKIFQNRLKLLYLSPEKVVQQDFINYLLDNNVKISLIAVDEAHCISMWGDDFREEYKDLKYILRKVNDIPIIALTATADSKTILDIQEICNIDDNNIFLNSFDRKNIKYSVIGKKTKLKKIPKKQRIINNKEYDLEKSDIKQLVNIINNYSGQSGIIYTFTRKETEVIAEILYRKYNIKALPYHAGLDDSKKNMVQEKFLSGKVDIVVATIAFGMGINKPDVRYVIHHTIPFSIDNYYQETGRAGRDGKESDAILLFSWDDVGRISQMMKDNENRIHYKRFRKMVDYSISNICRRTTLLKYFSEEYSGKCNKCDICNNGAGLIKNGKEVSLDILKTIHNLNQSRGVTTIAEILTGVKRSSLNIYNDFNTYEKYKGIYSKEEMIFFIKELEYKGYLYDFNINDNYHTVIKIDDKGLKLLDKDEGIDLSDISHFVKTKRDKNGTLIKPLKNRDIKTRENDSIDSVEYLLIKELKNYRLKKAKEKDIKPSYILSDKAIISIAKKRPFSKLELKRIQGVSNSIIKNYGRDILEICKHF